MLPKMPANVVLRFFIVSSPSGPTSAFAGFSPDSSFSVSGLSFFASSGSSFGNSTLFTAEVALLMVVPETVLVSDAAKINFTLKICRPKNFCAPLLALFHGTFFYWFLLTNSKIHILQKAFSIFKFNWWTFLDFFKIKFSWNGARNWTFRVGVEVR